LDICRTYGKHLLAGLQGQPLEFDVSQVT